MTDTERTLVKKIILVSVVAIISITLVATIAMVSNTVMTSNLIESIYDYDYQPNITNEQTINQ